MTDSHQTTEYNVDFTPIINRKMMVEKIKETQKAWAEGKRVFLVENGERVGELLPPESIT